MIKFICKHCKRENVVKDSWASWDKDKQEWVLEDILYYTYCKTCEGETTLEEIEISPSKTCPICHGDGISPYTQDLLPPDVCEKCNGTGNVK